MSPIDRCRPAMERSLAGNVTRNGRSNGKSAVKPPENARPGERLR
jgi:hypothetical protein